MAFVGREKVLERSSGCGGGVTPGEGEDEGDHPGALMGKFATAAVTLLPGPIALVSLPAPDPEPSSPSTAPGPISRRTIHALSGCSL